MAFFKGFAGVHGFLFTALQRHTVFFYCRLYRGPQLFITGFTGTHSYLARISFMANQSTVNWGVVSMVLLSGHIKRYSGLPYEG